MPTPDFSKIWASNSPLPAYTFSDEDYLEGWDFVGSAPPTKNEFDAWFKMVDEKLNYLYGQLQDTASKLYPVGSVYISFNSTDPTTLFGGTWVRLKDTFLLVNGDTYSPGSTGGSATKTISTNNLPSHTHTCSTVAGHTHTRGSMNITGTFSGVGQAYSSSPSSATLTGAMYRVNTTNNPAEGVRLNNESGTQRDDYFGFDASRSWSGATSTNGSHTHTIGNTGSGLPLNIMPPYTTVYAWKRTA